MVKRNYRKGKELKESRKENAAAIFSKDLLERKMLYYTVALLQGAKEVHQFLQESICARHWVE